MRHRLDANHKGLCDAVERMGWFVWNASQSGLGVDAILVKAGRMVPVEIKDGSKPLSAQKLTKHEQDVHATLKAHGVRVEILCSLDDLACLERVHPMRVEG